MGSQLGRARRAPLPNDIMWLDPMDISAGQLSALHLPSAAQIIPLGIVLYTYLRLKLHLRIAGFSPVCHDYDWRLGVDELGHDLAKRLAADPIAATDGRGSQPRRPGRPRRHGVAGRLENRASRADGHAERRLVCASAGAARRVRGSSQDRAPGSHRTPRSFWPRRSSTAFPASITCCPLAASPTAWIFSIRHRGPLPAPSVDPQMLATARLMSTRTGAA